jgi:Ca-activated chloride channel homolog
VAFGRFTGQGPIQMEFDGKVGGRTRHWQGSAMLPAQDTDNPEIERLWALSRIDAVMDAIRDKGETEARKKQIIDLGTAYSLVTDYTAMVVAKDAEMEGLGLPRRNADRVSRERRAQAARAAQPVKNYRVDRPAPSAGEGGKGGSLFGGRSVGVGSGPVGPFFVGLAYLLRRRKKQK